MSIPYRRIISLTNVTDSNLIFSFFSIFSFAIFYYFSKGSGVSIEKFILLAGYLLFHVNINIFKYRYIYCFSTLLILISLNIGWLFFLISFSGYILFAYVVFLSKHTFTRCLISLAFIIIYTFSYSFDGEGNIHYIRSLLDIHSKDIDLFMHSSISSHYKTYGHCTTGVHGFKSFEYWDLSNIICSKISVFLNVRSIDFYSFLYPAIIMPLLLKYSNDLVYRISDDLKIIKYFYYKHAITISLLVSLSFLTLHPYFGPIQNFLKWPCHRTFNLLIAFTISLKFILVLIELLRTNSLNYSKTIVAIYSLLFFYMIAKCKFYFIHYALLSSFILCFLHTSKENLSRIKVLFTCAILVLLYFTFYKSTKSFSYFEFKPFQIWKLNANEHHTLWSPISLGFPLILLIFLSNNKLYIKDLINIQKLRSKKYITFTILLMSFAMSLFPTFIYGGPLVRNVLYPINTYFFFFSIPFAIVLAKYLSSINYKNLSFNNIITLLFLCLTLLHSSSTALINFSNKLNYYQETLHDEVRINDKYQNIIHLTDTFRNLSQTKLPNSVLWVPKTNEDAWELLDTRQYAIPLVFSALTELPLIYGFPNLPDEEISQKSFEYSAFNKIPRNLDSDLNQALREAKKLGFENLYVLNSLSKLTLHKI